MVPFTGAGQDPTLTKVNKSPHESEIAKSRESRCNRGQLILVKSVELSPKSYTELDSKRFLKGHDVWSHVVLADARYTVKDVVGDVVCLSIAR